MHMNRIPMSGSARLQNEPRLNRTQSAKPAACPKQVLFSGKDIGKASVGWGVSDNDPAIVREGIRSGDDVNKLVTGKVYKDGLSPTATALSESAANALFGPGEQVNWVTHLHHLMYKDEPNPEIIDLLADAGLNVNTKDSLFGSTPLHTLLEKPKPSIPALKRLLAKGADVNAKDNGNRTPLHVLMSHHTPDTEAVSLLLKHGADPYIKNYNDLNPLSYHQEKYPGVSLQASETLNAFMKKNPQKPFLIRSVQFIWKDFIGTISTVWTDLKKLFGFITSRLKQP